MTQMDGRRVEIAAGRLGDAPLDPAVLPELPTELPPRPTEAVGRSFVVGMIDGLDLLRQPAVALDRMGFVLAANAAAEDLFDGEVRVSRRRLIVRDRRAGAELAALVKELRTAPDAAATKVDPIIVRRERKRPLAIRALAIREAAVLVMIDLQPAPAPDPDLVARAFDLTRAEARLAALVAGGAAPEQAARRLGVGRETVRSQLKAVFAKTGTHRQSELAALLLRLASLLLGALSLEPGSL